MARCRVNLALLLLTCVPCGVAAAGDHPQPDWQGSGWLGTAWGKSDRGLSFRRDPIVGAYGARAFDHDPYASYRNDNGCYRILPVTTSHGVWLRRVFVCDF